MNSIRPSGRYNWVRSRQLEGTFPGDKETGAWPITSFRITYGWGSLPEEYWPRGTGWPPDEPSGLDDIARKHRNLWPYRRVRSIEECKASQGVMVSLIITDKWANPWHGQIPASSADDIILPTMHTVLIVAFNSNRDEFTFQNSWGGHWGDQGYGYIRSERLAKTWCEGWRLIASRAEDSTLTGESRHIRTRILDRGDGSVLHWLELIDRDEPLAWAAGVQTSESFDIEELFVRPTCRRIGYGKELFQEMGKKAERCGLPLKMWISFADTAPENLSIVQRLVKPAGLTLGGSGVQWCPLAAATQINSRVDTFSYPQHPPSGHHELVRQVSEIITGVGTSVVGAFIYDALKSWLDPNNGKRINVKLGDMEISTERVSAEDVIRIAKSLKKINKEDQIRSTIEEIGVQVTVVKGKS